MLLQETSVGDAIIDVLLHVDTDERRNLFLGIGLTLGDIGSLREAMSCCCPAVTT